MLAEFVMQVLVNSVTQVAVDVVTQVAMDLDGLRWILCATGLTGLRNAFKFTCSCRAEGKSGEGGEALRGDQKGCEASCVL